ncbi:Transposase domain, partial [Microbulbifer thermotolerans]
MKEIKLDSWYLPLEWNPLFHGSSWKRRSSPSPPPKDGRGRQPYPLRVMLRIHCMQLFYNLSDPAMEDSLYEIESMRHFAGLTLTDRIPDETTILNFRHLLEQHQLGR